MFIFMIKIQFRKLYKKKKVIDLDLLKFTSVYLKC